MTQEIQERNEQIALMLGWEESNLSGIWHKKDDTANYVVYSEHNNYPHRGLPFHRDWNWLMEAVEFIESRGYEIDIFANCVEICTTPDEDYVSEAVGKTKKEAVFIAVSDFAKNHNLYNKKP